VREVRTRECLLNGGTVDGLGTGYFREKLEELEGFLELLSVQSCRVKVIGAMKVFWPTCLVTRVLGGFVPSRLFWEEGSPGLKGV